MTSPRTITPTILLLGLLGLLGAAPAAAGPEPQLGAAAQPGQDSASVVQVLLKPTKAAVAIGDTLRLSVELTVAEGWHLYAHGDSSYYGIDLGLPEQSPLVPVRIGYPKGKEKMLFGEKARVLEGRLTIPFTAVVRSSETGLAVVELTLTVQACNDRLCLAPAFLSLPMRLEILPRGRAS